MGVLATGGHIEGAPPRFLRLAGHPLRWRLLSELARSDRRVGELCALAERPQSLVSYHLRQLRDGGLVSARRSAADGRDSYYVLDLARCAELFAGAKGRDRLDAIVEKALKSAFLWDEVKDRLNRNPGANVLENEPT